MQSLVYTIADMKFQAEKIGAVVDSELIFKMMFEIAARVDSIQSKLEKATAKRV